MNEHERERYSLIGGIIVQWAHIEKRVWNGIHHIEGALGIPYTKLSATRNFAERKGILLKLVEGHGDKRAIRDVNRVLRIVDSHSMLRHALAHDYVDIGTAQKNRPVLITNFGDQGAALGEKMPSQTLKTVYELGIAYSNLAQARTELKNIEARITSDILQARPKKPEKD